MRQVDTAKRWVRSRVRVHQLALYLPQGDRTVYCPSPSPIRSHPVQFHVNAFIGQDAANIQSTYHRTVYIKTLAEYNNQTASVDPTQLDSPAPLPAHDVDVSHVVVSTNCSRHEFFGTTPDNFFYIFSIDIHCRGNHFRCGNSYNHAWLPYMSSGGFGWCVQAHLYSAPKSALQQQAPYTLLPPVCDDLYHGPFLRRPLEKNAYQRRG